MIVSTITGAAIGIMAGGLILSTIGVVGGTVAVASGKTVAEAVIMYAGVKQLIALGFLSYDVGSIITFLTTGTLFDFLELNPKYNTRQPIIGPKNK